MILFITTQNYSFHPRPSTILISTNFFLLFNQAATVERETNRRTDRSDVELSSKQSVQIGCDEMY